jgi:GlcNAc-PI de-N-acetylase
MRRWLVTTVFVFVIAGVLLGLLIAQKRSSAFTFYDVTADYQYQFAAPAVTVAPVVVSGLDLTAPASVIDPGTVFLELKIASTILGRFFDPELIVTTQTGQARQTFERGAKGLRYVNLSSLKLNANSKLKLEGKYLQIPDQTANFVYYQRNDVSGLKVLVVSPHPDDAEIAAFGLYNSPQSYVVTVTAGEAGELHAFSMFGDSNLGHTEKGKLRVWNSVSVPQLGGVSIDRTANLGYFDGTLAKMFANKSESVQSLRSGVSDVNVFRRASNAPFANRPTDSRPTWMSLVRDFEFILNQVQPDIIVTPYPALDNHPDHQYTTEAVIQALLNIKSSRGELFLYTNHFPKSYLYPYGSVGDAVSLPPSTDSPYFDRLYSHPLDLPLQMRKAMALDAMYDLRRDAPFAGISGHFGLTLIDLRESLTGNSADYFRRAVRSNELFFVVKVANLYEPRILKRLQSF